MRKKTYNENYFETIDSEDKAYFLGFIFADGCVTNDPKKYRYQLTLKLHSKDVGILEKFIKSIDGEMNIWKNKKRQTCEIFLSGKKIINDLDLKKKKFDYLIVLPWHFRDFIIEKEKNYLKEGKKLIFPLPEIEII